MLIIFDYFRKKIKRKNKAVQTIDDIYGSWYY